jgi:DNA-binding XRE family transcriptional regulator
MRTSTRKTATAVLREILGIKDFEMAEILDCSIHTIHSLESGRLKLSEKLATEIFHETGISIVWLLNGDPTPPPLTGRGEPYTKEAFHRAQAEKIHYDRPPQWSREIAQLGFCGRLVAILENASAKEDYSMAEYKVNAALDSLQKQFGIDEKLYRHQGPHVVDTRMAVALLKQIMELSVEWDQRMQAQLATVTPSKRKQPSKKRRRV